MIKNFINLKKEKNLISRNINIQGKQKKKSSHYKNINRQYKLAKKEYSKKRHDLIYKIRSELKLLNIPYEYFLGGIDMIADDTISYVKKDIFIFGISVSFFLIIILFVIFKSIKWVFIPLISTCLCNFNHDWYNWLLRMGNYSNFFKFYFSYAYSFYFNEYSHY